MVRTFRALLAIVFLAGIALLPPAAAFADPPVLPPLNPPPPAFLTCRATGNGAICEGARTLVEGPTDTGIVCGSGANAFDIFDQGGSLNQHVIRYYDQNGNLTRRVIQDNWDASQWSNPLTGHFIQYTQHNTITDDLAVPGDFNTATETNTGENIFRPPHSAPVFFSTGRIVTAPDGTIEFRAGQQNFLDVFVDGHTELLDPVCAALR
jgi:hypothetical protein